MAYIYMQASLVAQMVKSLPTMRETWVQFLDWEDPLEKDTAAHSSSPAWEIPRAEEHGGLQSMQSQESDTAEQLNPTTMPLRGLSLENILGGCASFLSTNLEAQNKANLFS